MNPGALQATSSAPGASRGSAPRTDSGGAGSAFPSLLAEAEETRSSAAATSPSTRPGPTEERPDPVEEPRVEAAEASLLVALGLTPLPLDPTPGGRWRAVHDSAAPFGSPVEVAAASLQTAPSQAGTGTTAADDAGRAALALSAAGALGSRAGAVVSADEAGLARFAFAATPASAALTRSLQPDSSGLSASTPELPGPEALRALAESADPGKSAPAPAVPAMAGPKGPVVTGTDALADPLGVESVGVQLPIGARASNTPRPAANFAAAPAAGPSIPPSLANGTRTSDGLLSVDPLVLDPGPSPEGLDGAASQPLRRGTGESGFLLPTATFGLERAELTASHRDSLVSLNPLLPGARLDPTAPQFSALLGQQLQWMASQQLGRAELRLDPEELGPLEIRLEMNGDEIRAEFSSRSADVRSLLESQVPRLRELLAEQGFSLADAQVGQERAAYQDAPQQREAWTSRSAKPEGAAIDTPETANGAPVRTRQGLVDDFA